MNGVVGNCEGSGIFLQQFNMRVAQLRVPLSGSMDLTHRCNLRCVHCYLDPTNTKHLHSQEEMKTGEVTGFLDEIT